MGITNKPDATKTSINLWDKNGTFLDDLVDKGYIHDKTHGINFIVDQTNKNKRIQDMLFPKSI